MMELSKATRAALAVISGLALAAFLAGGAITREGEWRRAPGALLALEPFLDLAWVFTPARIPRERPRGRNQHPPRC